MKWKGIAVLFCVLILLYISSKIWNVDCSDEARYICVPEYRPISNNSMSSSFSVPCDCDTTSTTTTITQPTTTTATTQTPSISEVPQSSIEDFTNLAEYCVYVKNNIAYRHECRWDGFMQKCTFLLKSGQKKIGLVKVEVSAQKNVGIPLEAL